MSKKIKNQSQSNVFVGEGVWFPMDIWADQRLTLIQKAVLIKVGQLSRSGNICYATNKYLSEFCGCSDSSVTNAITRLTELKLIENLGGDGRHRYLRALINISPTPNDNISSESEYF